MSQGRLPSARNRLEGRILVRIPLQMLLGRIQGYHQIQMAEEHEEKTAFIQNQRAFFWLITKMPSVYWNVGVQISAASGQNIPRIVARHEIPVSIICDRVGRFTCQISGNIISDKLWGHFMAKYRNTCVLADVREAQTYVPELIKKHGKDRPDFKQRFKLSGATIRAVDLKRKPMEFEVRDRVMLKKCYADATIIIAVRRIHIDDKLLLSYSLWKSPVEIMEREIKRLKRSRIPLVKVRWNSRRGPEFTWEREDSFKQKYPQLFTNRASSSTTRS
ncbi:hypothetical protein Tco_1404879 [Tanacetum coccineum]